MIFRLKLLPQVLCSPHHSACPCQPSQVSPAPPSPPSSPCPGSTQMMFDWNVRTETLLLLLQAVLLYYKYYDSIIQTFLQLIFQLLECCLSSCFIFCPATMNKVSIIIIKTLLFLLLSKAFLPCLVLLLPVPHPLVAGALHPIPIHKAHFQAVLSQLVHL